MLEELATAAQRRQLSVVYQPIYDSKTRAVTALEALLRWTHPVLGAVSPADFIELAESNGLIVDIGDWVIETVCAQVADWAKRGYSMPRVCINVSARQFEHRGFAHRVLEALSRNGLQPEQIELELTETRAFANFESAASTMEGLRAAGIRLSIDDFGAGSTSLKLAGVLPMSTLKIDRCLVDAIGCDARRQAIVSCIVSMSRKLGMRTVAEGVDSLDSARILTMIGCDELQGHYFAVPLQADAVLTMLYPSCAA